MDPTNTVGPEVPLSTPEKKDGHWIAIAAMALFVAASLVAVGFLYYQNQKLKSMLTTYQTTPTMTPYPTIIETPEATASSSPKVSPHPTPKACTQEAKICPNGKAVGRTGPNCEFAACPTP